MSREPSSRGSVRFPAAYGTPGGPDSFLPWGYIEERIRAASNYWLTTVGPNARPHARPVDGVWVGGALCFSGQAPPFRPFWTLRPTTALAWTLEGFPRGATRWRFEKS